MAMKKVNVIVTSILLFLCFTSMKVNALTTSATTNYKIIYNLAGGINSELNPADYQENEAVVLKAPTKAGYRFAGWYSDETLTKKVTSIRDKNEDITLYAKWVSNIYTIRFNGNGAAGGSMSDVTKRNYGTNYTLPANKYYRTGHTFVGWNTKKDGTGVTYKDAASVKNLTTTHNGVATLYAMWTPTNYKITYNLNGGVNNSVNPSTYTVKSIVSLKAPTKAGYRFAGWYNDDTLTKKVTTIKASTGNKVLYAKWVPNLYTIRFNGNGAAGGSMNDLTKRNYGTNYTLPANKYYRTGHTFVGWNTKKDGTGVTYKDAASAKNLTTTHNGVATLYAMWTPTNYKITYNLNGGVNNKSNPSTYTVKSSTITFKNPTRAGYIFAGWYSDVTFTKKVTVINKASTGNVTLYAKWMISTPVIKSLSQTNYYQVKIEINPVAGADGYIIYRSKSQNTGYVVAATTTSNSYIDGDLLATTKYYYKVQAYFKDANGKQVKSATSKIMNIVTAEEPKFVVQIANNINEYSNYGILYVKNNGNKRLYIGGSSLTNFGLLYPYNNANYTKGTLISDGITRDAIYIDPNESGYVYFKLDNSRIIYNDARMTFTFVYDGCIYFGTAYVSKRGMYV